MKDTPFFAQIYKRLKNTYHKQLYNLALKGVLWLAIYLAGAGLILSLLAYYFADVYWFRYTIWYTYLALALGLGIYKVIFPFIYRLGFLRHEILDYIVPLVNKRFQKLKDVLTNMVELYKLEQGQEKGNTLLQAAIEAKASYANRFPVEKSINYKENIRYVLFFLGIGVIILTMYFVAPQQFKQSLKAFANPAMAIETGDNYMYSILNDSLAVGQGDNFTLKVNFAGTKIPSRLYLKSWGDKFLMKEKENKTFYYTFNSVNNAIHFRLSDDDWKSKEYSLKVLPKPTLDYFSVNINVPAYTGKQDMEKQNTGNLKIPEGSEVKWRFVTTEVDSLNFMLGDKQKAVSREGDTYRYGHTFYSSADYTIGLQNKFFTDSNVIKYSINVEKDQFPEIAAKEQKDSVAPSRRYFYGNISDDYGFNKLEMVISSGLKNGKDSIYRVPINPNVTYQEFYFSYDFSRLPTDNKRYVYYFRVWDNDGVNGPKSAKSNEFTYKILTKGEVDSLERQKNKQMANSIKEGMKVAQQLQQQLDDLKNQSLSKNISSWERNKLLQDIQKKQKRLQDLMEQSKELSKEKRQAEPKEDQKNKELLEKQERLEELMDQVMDDELKELMKELEKLQEQFNEKNMMKLQKDMEYSYEELEKQLDRNFELMKKLQVEEELNRLSDAFKDLAREQEQLKEITEEENLGKEDIRKRQKELQKEFQQLEQDLDSTNSMNNNLEYPYKLSDFKEQRKQIDQNFQDINESNEKMFNKQKMQEQQQKNADQLKKMGQSMQQMLERNQQQMTMLNLNNLRQIMSNLLTFSFKTENLETKLNYTNTRDPQYVEFLKEQKNLQLDFEIVRDSLYALSKKSFQLDKPINKEVISITRNLSEIIKLLEDRKVQHAANKQRKVITSSNELALLLSEILNNMRDNMGKGMGQGKPQKGQANKPSISQMKNMQQGLKNELKRMLKQMKKSGKDGKGQSEDLAKMLSEQEKFQRKLRQMRNEGNMPQEMEQILKQIEQMTDDVKEDIVEREISPQTLKRQNNILTRLLDAEDAERKRDFEKKREAKSAKYQPMSNPDSIFPYNKTDKTFTEKLRLHRLKLQDFYEKKYKFYLQGIGQ